MSAARLLQSPLPIDRTAARVVKKAKPEDVWQPMPKHSEDHVPVGAVLRVVPLGKAVGDAWPELKSIAGKRRDRLTILGVSAHQGSKKQGLKWVVRCDCGNMEHRTNIMRWLGTEASDMCRECRNRQYLLRGPSANDRAPAKRATANWGKQ